MSAWYKSTLSYFRTTEDGTGKRVSEEYIVDAVSFTEAESRLYEKLDGLPEFSVNRVTKTSITDVYHNPKAGHWFKAKIAYTSYDEASGKEKTVSNQCLVQADDIIEAYNTIKERLKGLQVPMSIPSIAKTKVMDVFPFETTIETEVTGVEVKEVEVGEQ